MLRRIKPYEQEDIKFINDKAPCHTIVQFTDGRIVCSCGSDTWDWE